MADGSGPFKVHDPAHAQRLPEELRAFTPDTLDAAALAHADIHLERFGRMRSRSAGAIRHLSALPPERPLHISYDRIVADPLPELTRFGRFADTPEPEAWATRVAGRVDTARTGASGRLSTEQAGELHEACAPGTRRLAEFLGERPPV